MSFREEIARKLGVILVISTFIIPATAAAADDDISLYDSTGAAVAYISPSDQMTIYLWDGTPVAYLDQDGTSVYGFNGEHLGWLQGAVIIGRDGNVACAMKDALANPQLEPLKGLKRLPPLRSIEQIAPIKPIQLNSWSDVSCTVLLTTGQS